jgi:aminomethyltransferase
VSGEGATAFVERLVPVSTESLRHPAQGRTFGDSADGPYLGSLSVLLNEQGGIIDDLIVTRQGEET